MCARQRHECHCPVIGVDWKLVWGLVRTWFGIGLEAGLGVGWKMVWELAVSWLAGWLEYGSEACCVLFWGLAGTAAHGLAGNWFGVLRVNWFGGRLEPSLIVGQ